MEANIANYFNTLTKWKKELLSLRKIILTNELNETLKWNVPIYTDRNKNIVGINALKNNCALAFFKGALIEDNYKILIQPGKHTQMARWVKFSSIDEIIKHEKIINSYIQQAIQIERSGQKLEPTLISRLEIPFEFQVMLNQNIELKLAFNQLSLGRQRTYLFYFAQAKQVKTRTERIQRFLPKILAGKGMHD